MIEIAEQVLAALVDAAGISDRLPQHRVTLLIDDLALK